MNVATVICDVDLVDDAVEALNYLRECVGLRFLCSAGELSDNAFSFKVLLHGGKSERAAMESAIGGENITWRMAQGTLSNPWVFKAERRLKAAGANCLLTREDLLPQNDAPSDPFEGLVGMESQTDRVKEIAAAIEAYGRDALDSLGMVFVGSPGTGKTELAQRLSRYCRLSGINTGKFVHASAATLISNHVGETPIFVNNAFNEAKGGILFIDEAYALTQGSSNDYGAEAVNQLVECLDAHRKDVMVVAAGYPKEMEEFLSANPGLRDRFGFRVEFPDYTDEQLAQIFRSLANAKEFKLTNELEEGLKEGIAGIKQDKDFANARSVRNLLQKVIIEAAQAHPSQRYLDVRDFKAAIVKLGYERPSREMRMGFA